MPPPASLAKELAAEGQDQAQDEKENVNSAPNTLGAVLEVFQSTAEDHTNSAYSFVH